MNEFLQSLAAAARLAVTIDEAHLPQRLIVALSNIKRDAGRDVFWYAAQSSVKWQWFRSTSGPRSSYRSAAAATALLHKGVDVGTIAKLGRWKSAEHVFKTYGHAKEDRTLTDLISDTPLTQPKKKNTKIIKKTGT